MMEAPKTHRTLDDIEHTLRQASAHDRKCSLLIGAGCSVSAGIPLASQFVEEIANIFPRAYDRAKINWAHIAIAQLMLKGYVDRILTTNFDPLIMRACAMVGFFPSIYDLAASQEFRPADVLGEAVFHLHGQHSGFILLNTPEEMEGNSKRLKPVFEDAGQGRTWIVVGYSGENDPVFQHLADVQRFDHNLYWIGYKDSDPPQHVEESLLQDGKYAFYVPDYDADSFFVKLAQRLDCFPPAFAENPFSYLDGRFDDIMPFQLDGDPSSSDPLATARTMIRDAKVASLTGTNINTDGQTATSTGTDIESPEKSEAIALRANSLLMAGQYKEIISLYGSLSPVPQSLSEPLTWAYVNLGNALLKQAKTKTGPEADELLRDVAIAAIGA